jgi:serine/threonine-protein kinase
VVEQGQQFGEFILRECLGQGSFGTVWRAENTLALQESERTVALKIPHPRHQGQESLLREARQLAQLRHDNIVQVYRAGQVDGQFFLVMEYLPGGSVADRLQAEAMTLDQAMRTARQFLSGLAYAHQRGFVHCDVKPGNILFDDQDVAHVVDFGSARFLLAQGVAANLIGTPGYMSPEMGRASAAIPASDVWSAAVVIYEMATGERLFPQGFLGEPEVSLERVAAALPALLHPVVLPGLQRDPGARFQNAGEMRQALYEVERGGRLRPAWTSIVTAPARFVVPRGRRRTEDGGRKTEDGGRKTEDGEPRPSSSPSFRVSEFPSFRVSQFPNWFEETDDSRLALIPAGSFQMGSADGPAREQPVHEVHLEAFLIDDCPVTNAQYYRFVEATGYPELEHWRQARESGRRCAAGRPFPDEWADHPAIHVSWEEAQAYAQWIGKRLPTEAEWEKSARGSEGFPYAYGPQYTERAANTGLAVGGLTPVRTYPANGYGLYDLTGNVWEWCQDWYDAEYYEYCPLQNPLGPPAGTRRVVRGGCWANGEAHSRCAERACEAPHARSPFIGFRCARDAASEEGP